MTCTPPRAAPTKSLIHHRGHTLCRQLQIHYTGLRFNRVQLTFPPALLLHEQPLREDIEVRFNVSGSANDLTRHGFAHPEWLRNLRPAGIRHDCDIRAFGTVRDIVRTQGTYRLRGATYIDSMAKLAVALFPGTWIAVTASRAGNEMRPERRVRSDRRVLFDRRVRSDRRQQES